MLLISQLPLHLAVHYMGMKTSIMVNYENSQKTAKVLQNQPMPNILFSSQLEYLNFNID